MAVSRDDEEDELGRRVAERTAELEAATAAAARALRESEARFRALIENSFDITAITDRDGVIRYVSPSVARIFGYQPAELEGATFLGFVHPDEVEEVANAFADVASQPGQVQIPEFRARHVDGSWRLLEAICLNRLDDPAIQGIVFNVRDVSARRTLETRLQQSERLDAIGQLAGGVAHDFNNILLVIRGYSSVLRASLEDEQQIADLDEILSAADRAAELTRHLLAFGRRQVLQASAVDVVGAVRKIESLLSHSIPEHVELTVDLSDGVPPVVVDSTRLDQIIVNLVVNARDAMPSGGRIALSVASAVLTGAESGIAPPVPHGSYVVLSVADTGSGISEAVLPHVFEPFFTTKEEGVGTGLGLSTVYGIVVQSGGGIEVRSQVGHGTTFTVYFPVAPAVGETAAVPAAPEATDSQPTETILLVEDERAVRELVRRVLENEGYRVLPAERPSDAERLLEGREDVDLLLSDVVMPEMSGYELAARVLERRPTLKTMFMSGYSQPQSGDRHVPGELLKKPFTTEELMRVVRRTLDA